MTRHIRRASILLATALMLGGCGSAALPAVGAPDSVMPSTVPGESTGPTAATVEPALTKEELSALYLAAAKRVNSAEKKADDKLPKYPSGKQWKRWCRTAAAAELRFQEEVAAIAWPEDYAADVRDLLKADAKLELLYLQCSKASSKASLYKTLDRIDRVNESTSARANFLRHRLGLPSVPIF